MIGFVRVCALLLLVLTSLNAQRAESATDGRVATVGRVVDRAGKAWPGAKVVLLSRVHPLCAEETVDRVEVVSDARGKFRAFLERDRVYLAWAWGPAGEGREGFRMTRLAVKTLPGLVFRLVEAKPRAARHVRIQDMRAKKGPLRLVLCSHRPGFSRTDRGEFREGMGFTFPVELDSSGRATIPALPWETLWMEIYDAGGFRLQIETLRDLSVWTEGEKVYSIQDAPEMKVQARAVKGLGTIDGLTLYQRIRGRMHEVRRVGAGDSMPLRSRIATRMIQMSRAETDYAALELGAKGSVRAFLLRQLDGQEEEGEAANQWIMPLAPERTLQAKLEKPRLLILQQNPRGRPGAFMATMAPYPVYERRARADGRFLLGGLGSGDYRLSTPLTVAERDALRGEASIEPLALLAAGNLDKHRDLGALDPARLARVDVSLSFSDGKKARGVRILLLQQGNPASRNAVILRSLTDRSGRRRLLVPVGQRFEVLVVSERGSTVLSLDLREAGPGSVHPVNLTIPVGVRIRGQVVDAAGDPCAGSQLTWMGRSGVSRAGVLAKRVAQDYFTLKTDDEGRFSFIAPLQKGELWLFTKADAKRPTILKKLRLDGEEIDGLEVVVANR